MDIIIRRLLLTASVILFLVITPIVVLYALGYRENLITSPTAVGVLLLDAIPERANVVVNDKSYGTTPESISNLKVGNVSIKVSLDGYHSWQKNLPILPARATEARSIRLFLEDPPTQILSTAVQKFALAPNRTLLVWTDQANTLHLHSTENEMLFTPLKLAAPPTDLLWSSDSSYILVSYANDRYQIVDIARPTLEAESIPAIRGLIDPSWDMRTPGRVLFRDPKTSQLVRYTLRQNQKEILVNNVTTYAVSSRQLYVLNNRQQLLRLSLDGELRETETIELPNNDTISRLLVTPTDDIAAISVANNLYLIPNNSDPQLISSNITHAAWSPDASMLLIQPQPNELVVYNVNNERAFHLPLEQTHLVTRLSRPIQHAQWFAGGQHFIYQMDDAIIITEIDTRDHPISHTVDTTNLGDSSVTVGRDGQVLYYLKRKGDATHLIATTLYLDQ